MMISVVICTYNREKFIGECLMSLTVQTADISKYEIIVVNNNSTDKTGCIIESFINGFPKHKWHYVIEKNQGLSYARNRGIKESKGNVLAFLDDDAIANPNYIKYLLEKFSVSNFDAGGGKILPQWESQKPDWMNRYLLPLVSVLDLGVKQHAFKGNQYPIGANMFFKSHVFEEIGFFDTSLGRKGKRLLGGEEKDIFNRMKSSGHEVGYFPDIWVLHIVPDERTEIGFIKNQALGIGMSERIRTSDKKITFLSRILLELIKWIATFILMIYYLIFLRFSTAKMLVSFRWWVSKGLFSK